MMKCKQFFTFLVIINSLVCTAQSLSWWPWGNNQKNERVNNYIEHLIDTLFDTPSQDQTGRQDIRDFKAEAQYTIANSSNVQITHDSFNADVVQQMVLSEALTFIRNKSYACALQVAHSFDSSYAQIDKRKIANEVADKLQHQAEDKTFKAAELSGIYRPYVGARLKTLVYPLVQELVRKYGRPSSPKPPIAYDLDEDECNTCLEDFDRAEHKRIVLSCRHSLCKKCVLKISDRDKLCPKCRKPTVKVAELSSQLWSS